MDDLCATMTPRQRALDRLFKLDEAIHFSQDGFAIRSMQERRKVAQAEYDALSRQEGQD